MLGSGAATGLVGAAQALEVLRGAAHKQLANILTPMITDVEQGTPLSKAMANRAPAFDSMAVQVLSVSEYAGELDRGLKMLAEQFDAEDKRVATLREALRLAKLRYRSGVASQLDVLDAERNLLAAELNRSDALRAQRAAVADLFKALGGGWNPGS